MEELKEKVLEVLNSRFVSHRGLNNLASILSRFLKEDADEVRSVILDLIDSGDVVEISKNKFAGIRIVGFVKGKFSYSNPSFGFVLNDNGDIYISRKNFNGAFDGDEVLVKIIGKAHKDKKREGKIIKIIARDNDGLLGTFHDFNNYGLVDLDKKRMQVRINKEDFLGAKEGDKVVIDIKSYKAGCPLGQVVEVIGSLDKKGNDIKYFLRKYKVREDFPLSVMTEAKKIPQTIDKSKFKDRVDLTSEMIFTIDGKDAKDLDDAVSLKKCADGSFILGVHIADVGEYVRLNSIIDKEAYERGTSIYFLDKVIPMLPRELSNGICSLNEKVDRLALSVEMKIDKTGEVLDSKIFESIIRSQHRLNYDEVLEVIEGNADTQARLADIKDMILDMHELSTILENRRNKFGALNFEIPEGEVLLDENGKAKEIEVRKATKSTKLIETFMVVTNETIARTFDKLKIPFVYRVHEKPDSEKIKTFFNFIDTLGLKIPVSPKKQIEPKDLQGVLEEAQDKDSKGVVNMVMLRSLKKAKYLNKCLGHFGMALEFYSHFTSPIRRYPDLTIHRIIKEYLHGNLSFVKSKEMAGFVIKASDKSSVQERTAEEVERAITDYKKCEYMLGFAGSEFDGIISGVTNKGFYVELDNTCEGLVPVSSLTDDFYEYDEEKLMLKGKRNYYRIGEKVRVKMIDAIPLERKINFEVIKKLR